MAADLKTTLALALKCLEQSSIQGAGARRSQLEHGRTYSMSLPNGTAANQSDLVYSVAGTVTAAAPDDYDLRGGLVSLLTGAAAAFVEITALVLINESSVAGESITVGAGGANPVSSIWAAAGDGAVVGPGGIFVLTSPIDGYATTAATADIIRISTGTATAVAYRLIIIGRSA